MLARIFLVLLVAGVGVEAIHVNEEREMLESGEQTELWDACGVTGWNPTNCEACVESTTLIRGYKCAWCVDADGNGSCMKNAAKCPDTTNKLVSKQTNGITSLFRDRRVRRDIKKFPTCSSFHREEDSQLAGKRFTCECSRCFDEKDCNLDSSWMGSHPYYDTFDTCKDACDYFSRCVDGKHKNLEDFEDDVSMPKCMVFPGLFGPPETIDESPGEVLPDFNDRKIENVWELSNFLKGSKTFVHTVLVLKLEPTRGVQADTEDIENISNHVLLEFMGNYDGSGKIYVQRPHFNNPEDFTRREVEFVNQVKDSVDENEKVRKLAVMLSDMPNQDWASYTILHGPTSAQGHTWRDVVQKCKLYGGSTNVEWKYSITGSNCQHFTQALYKGLTGEEIPLANSKMLGVARAFFKVAEPDPAIFENAIVN